MRSATLAVSQPDPELVRMSALSKQLFAEAKLAKVLLPSQVPEYQEPERPKMNINYLHAVMIEAIEDFGGSSHPSTLAMYAMRIWNRSDVEGPDDEFDFQDFRKAVKLELKRNPEMFERVMGKDSQYLEWTLTAEERKLRLRSLQKWAKVGFRDSRVLNEKNMASWLRETLGARDTGMNINQLEILVESFWKRSGGPFGATDLMLMTLQTNPCFHDHDRDPTLWELAAQSLSNKGGESRSFLNRSLGNSVAGLQSPVSLGIMHQQQPQQPQQQQSQSLQQPLQPTSDSGFKRPERTRRRERSLSPRETSPSRRGKRKKETPATSETQWIQCDRCHKWVSTLDDKITDLSLYDDLNPQHLDYHCPICREEDEVDAKRNNSLPKSKRVAQEVAAALDEFEKELVTQFRNSRSYWRRTMPNATGASDLEDQFLQSAQHYKQRLIKSEDDVASAKISFREFFLDQLSHLKESLAGLKAKQ